MGNGYRLIGAERCTTYLTRLFLPLQELSTPCPHASCASPLCATVDVFRSSLLAIVLPLPLVLSWDTCTSMGRKKVRGRGRLRCKFRVTFRVMGRSTWGICLRRRKQWQRGFQRDCLCMSCVPQFYFPIRFCECSQAALQQLRGSCPWCASTIHV
jgi:hypothetical protein